MHKFYGNDFNFDLSSAAGIDSLKHVAEDIGLDFSRTVTLQQIHSADVIHVTNHEFKERQADAMVTNTPDLILCIRTADCAPILLEDSQNNVIGAVHAGWRGALNGVIENTIAKMVELGARTENISAHVGAMLLEKSFVCQDDMREEFLKKDPSFSKYFNVMDDGNLHFNYENFIKDKLKSCGLCSIEMSDIDTYTSPEFHSYRRAKHQGLDHDARNCAAIYIKQGESK